MVQLYINNVLFLEEGLHLKRASKEAYLSHHCEDPFDSFQYLHLASHHQLGVVNSPNRRNINADGFFLKSDKMSQSELACTLIQTQIKGQMDYDLFVYCHDSFGEDLSVCIPSYIRHKMEMNCPASFTVEHQGGVTFVSALEEIDIFLTDGPDNARALLIGAERILSPYHRKHLPLTWLSDGAAGFTLSKRKMEKSQFRIFGVDWSYNERKLWQSHTNRDAIFDETIEFVEDHKKKFKLEGVIIYPSFDPDFLCKFLQRSTNHVWKDGLFGSIQGLEVVGQLKTLKVAKGEKVHLIFAKLPDQIASISLEKI